MRNIKHAYQLISNPIKNDSKTDYIRAAVRARARLRLERVGLPPKERAAAAAGRRLPPSAAPRVVFGGPAASLRARKENGRENKMGAKTKWARKENGRENKMGARTKWARKQNGRENKMGAKKREKTAAYIWPSDRLFDHCASFF